MNTPAAAPAYPPAPFGAAEPTATALLTIDLDALCANYRALRGMAAGAETAAVIKANAYGTGAARAAQALSSQGCKTFFVATFGEGETVLEAVPEATVYILDGLFPGSAPAFIRTGLLPVLSSLEEANEWVAFCADTNTSHPAALHVDTGMNRLGLTTEQAIALFAGAHPFVPSLLISHLACADEPAHLKNAQQLKAFIAVRAVLPPCPASLANSGGILMGTEFHFDLVRAGVALYGGEAATGHSALNPVVQLHARIAQLHHAEAGETVGYGASRTLSRRTRIATVAMGYADGIFRHLGKASPGQSLEGFIDGQPAPVLGRVSMDLVTLDVTDIPPDKVHRGGWVEIIGPHMSIDDIARRAGTIGYEVLTSIGRRAQRVYVDSNGDPA